MKNRKYRMYILNADFGSINEKYTNYVNAIKGYRCINAPKTLYGVTDKGSINVIFSKG